MSEINQRLKKAREKLFNERSKSELCRLLNVPKGTYQGYEKDTDIPSSFIKKLCEITSINSEWLLFGIGDMIKPLPGGKRPRINRGSLDRRSGGNLLKYLILLETINDGEIKESIEECAKTLEHKIYTYLKQKQVEKE